VTAGFDLASAVGPALAPGGDGGDGGTHAFHRVELDPAWTIGGKPNGGYLLATMARAALASVAAIEGPAHPHPVTATAHYVASPDPGPAEVHVELLRRGRRKSQARARLVRDGDVCVEAAFTLGRHDPAAEPWWTDVAAPVLPPVDDCLRLPAVGTSGIALPIMELVDIRLDPAVAGFRRGAPAGRGELRGWLAFADGRAPDPLSLLFALDAFPPATFDRASTGWVPTLELTAYVRAVPAPGPLRVRQRARLVEADLVDEVCHVWDSRGRLVAQATQLAGIRVGDAPAPPSVH
jgi:acyl-coenzyme A thioesterase PaaI-like protein